MAVKVVLSTSKGSRARPLVRLRKSCGARVERKVSAPGNHHVMKWECLIWLEIEDNRGIALLQICHQDFNMSKTQWKSKEIQVERVQVIREQIQEDFGCRNFGTSRKTVGHVITLGGSSSKSEPERHSGKIFGFGKDFEKHSVLNLRFHKY